ncbi:MAG: hypothetical protein IJN63_07285 [Clostridia bacterium]|nr:hypothetical protein [Clostridia bacterium]
MELFYRPPKGELPAVICDTGFGIMFANRAAYSCGVTLRWLEKGRPSLDCGVGEAMEQSFSADPHAIAVIPYRENGLRYTLLADRLLAEGTCVYVLAVAASNGGDARIASELDGRRMMTACFTPRTDKAFMPATDARVLVKTWFSELCSYVPLLSGRARLITEEDAPCCGFMGSEPFVCCITSLLSAFLSAASGALDIGVSFRKGSFAVTVSGLVEGTRYLTGDVSNSLAACFPLRLPQVLLCLHVAKSGGFGVSFSADGADRLSVTLDVPVYDAGELGFKALETLNSFVSDCIRSAGALLF